MNKIIKIVLIVFFILGILLLLGSLFMTYQQLNFVHQAQTTLAVVVDNKISSSKDSNGKQSVTYCPIFQFSEAGGQRYSIRSHTCSRPARYAIGERVEVLYRPDDPNEARLNNFGSLYLAPLILAILGGLFTLVGVVVFTLNHLRNKRKNQLLQTGRRIEALISDMSLNTVIRVNGRSPFIIYAQWCDPLANSGLYQFKSDAIWFDPSPFIKEKTISVYIDEKNPKRYYVDIRFLPKMR